MGSVRLARARDRWVNPFVYPRAIVAPTALSPPQLLAWGLIFWLRRKRLSGHKQPRPQKVCCNFARKPEECVPHHPDRSC